MSSQSSDNNNNNNNNNKERDILERQRRLAAQLLNGNNNSSTAGTIRTQRRPPPPPPSSSTSLLKKPPPPPPASAPSNNPYHRSADASSNYSSSSSVPAVVNKATKNTLTTNNNNNNNSSSSVIDLTLDSPTKGNSTMSISAKTTTKTIRPTAATTTTTTTTSIPTRPTFKRPKSSSRTATSATTNSAATILANARAKASGNHQQRQQSSSNDDDDDQDTRRDCDSDMKPSCRMNNRGTNNSDEVTVLKQQQQRQSPRVQRKTIDKLSSSKKVTSSLTLASLVQRVVASTSGSGSSNDGVTNDPHANANDSNSTIPPYQPDDFWKNLRDWDLPSQYYYETQLQQQQQTADPDAAAAAAANQSTSSGGNNQKPPPIPPIPDTFINARHYISAWAPLCMAECRSQLLQEMVVSSNSNNNNMSQTTNPILVTVESTQPYHHHSSSSKRNGGGGGTRDYNNNTNSSVSSWLDDGETAGYVKISCIKGKNQPTVSFFPNDIILLVQEPYREIIRNIGNGTQSPTNRNDFSNGNFEDDAMISTNAFMGVSLIGHMETSRRELDGLILKVSKRKWTKYGTKQMYFIKVGSNVTALREFTALCSMMTLPMATFLLGQHLHREEHRRKLSRNQPMEQLISQMGGVEKLGDGFIQYACQKYNQSQLTAIAASAHEYGEGGFTLIKGPPGTGKTTTLVAILNSLHIRQFNKYYDEVRRIATKATGSREAALATARGAKPRLLVCAPSNAAIDNIILKIMEDGFIDGQGRRYNPSMIRVGVGQSHQVRDVALSTKVDGIFAENMDAQQLQASIAGYRTELTRIAQEIANVRRRAHAIEISTPWPLSKDWEIRIDENTFEQAGKAFFVNHVDQTTTYEVPPPPEPGATHFKATSMPEYRAYVSRLVKLVENYFSTKTHLERCTIVKASMETGANQFEIRLSLESHVLNSVHMVMTTLGSAGNRTLEAADRFEVIVVDEAAQSVEPASLSALRLGSRHAVLVGDPQQLPATIFNVSGRHTKYDRSLFQRLEEAGQPVYMLNEQYRMHPKISHFPRNIFYGGGLLDGPNVRQPDYGNPLRALLCRAIPTFSPLTILDLDSKEERGGTSLSNMSEAKLAVFMYDQLKIHSRGISATTKVAVITPYAQQCRLLRDLFADRLGPQYESMVEVNTVDAFQGREANIVIFSAVRAAGSRGIGFLSDVRRMNVALTRAKHFLFIIARCASIVVNPYWSDLIEHARETNAVLRVPLIGMYPNNVSFGEVTSWQLEKKSNADVMAGKPTAASTVASTTAPIENSFNFSTAILPQPPVDPRKRKKRLL